MLAVDTNVVLRYLVKDDEAQSARARDVFRGGPVFISPTVVLECEWALRSLYEFSRLEVVGALKAFCGSPNVTVGEAEAVKLAFRLTARDLDFAGALHLALAEDCEAFATFDNRLAKRASNLGGVAVRLV